MPGRRTVSWARGGPPNSLVKKSTCSVFGLPSLIVKATILPRRVTWNGCRTLPCFTWKPVTCPIAWQFSGQEAAGRGFWTPSSITRACAAGAASRQAKAAHVTNSHLIGLALNTTGRPG